MSDSTQAIEETDISDEPGAYRLTVERDASGTIAVVEQWHGLEGASVEFSPSEWDRAGALMGTPSARGIIETCAKLADKEASANEGYRETARAGDRDRADEQYTAFMVASRIATEIRLIDPSTLPPSADAGAVTREEAEALRKAVDLGRAMAIMRAPDIDVSMYDRALATIDRLDAAKKGGR